MPNYRRQWIPGGTYFFTVNLLRRHGNDLLVRHIAELRDSVALVRQRHSFDIHAWVVLPEHMHCVLSLPDGDADFPVRWRLIKAGFSRRIESQEQRSEVRVARGERGIWQRRYWDHRIRNESDFEAHVNYVHINPLKHGLVRRVVDWPYSTFHRYVRDGVYSADWGVGVSVLPEYDD